MTTQTLIRNALRPITLRKPGRKEDAEPATRGSPDAGTVPPRKRGKDY